MNSPHRIADKSWGAAFYPAHVPIQSRQKPGLQYALTGQGWMWTGRRSEQPCALIDVMAGLVLAGQSHERATQPHADALREALRRGDEPLAGLLGEPAGDAVDLIDLAGLAVIAKVSYATAKSYRTLTESGRRTPPGIVSAGTGSKRIWLWSRRQLHNWMAARPGKGYRMPQDWTADRR